jgi:hypothetical protein
MEPTKQLGPIGLVLEGPRWVFRRSSINDLQYPYIHAAIDFDFWLSQIKHSKSKSSQIQSAKVKVMSSQIRSQKLNTVYFLGYKQAAPSLPVAVLIVYVVSW